MAAARPNRMHRNHRAIAPHRSFLLEDFRENRYPNLQLNEIVAHVVEFAKDHDGSKFIQRKMDEATDTRKEALFREMQPHLLMLMKDTFGNFVVQKFFDIGTQPQRQELLRLIQTDFMALSMHKYGCRVVQTAIQKSTLPEQIFIMQFASPSDFVQLARNANGNHVIQKCFHYVPQMLQDYLFEQLKFQIFDLCLDLYGCRVIQCVLIKGTSNHRRDIFHELVKNPLQLMRLIQDRYGNYVIQHAVQYCAPDEKARLVEFIVTHVVLLAQQKYSSNVVEKCLANASQTMQDHAMFIICNRQSEAVKALCIDAYANYVIQKLIECVSPLLVANLYERVQPHFKEMQRHVCGRKIIEMLQQNGYP
ncbi:pumilio homolog 2-like [Sitodiplosis mosellana]|uniref:pumilio homolog 2-like n=1 Tax=Sitodiplosis mosellana TaxID=263140 RepID=UPI0024449681|nr:pumilio homolog 2-like [Sitodiplosis mosellana]